MFFSNSQIILEISSCERGVFEDKLRNNSFFEKNNNKAGTHKFYSIQFYNEEKDIGEIHYTQSYEYGKINIINFIRKKNIFFIYISSVQQLINVKKIINKMLEKECDYKIIKMDNILQNIVEYKNFRLINKDDLIGISGMLEVENKEYLLNFYSNGVVTYRFNNNLEFLKSLIVFCMEVIEFNE